MVVELFSTVIAGFCVIGIVRSSVVGPVSFESAVTTLYSTPLSAVGDPFASSSACVKVCVAVQVMFAPTASVVLGQLMSSLSLSSVSMMPVRVTLPVFVTR